VDHQFVFREVTEVPIGISRHASLDISEDRLERRQDLGGGLVARLAPGRLKGALALAQKLVKAPSVGPGLMTAEPTVVAGASCDKFAREM